MLFNSYNKHENQIKKTFFLLGFLCSLSLFIYNSCISSGVILSESHDLSDDHQAINDRLLATVGFVRPFPISPGTSNEPSSLESILTSNYSTYRLPYCAGFFVDQTHIVSAYHCFQPTVALTMPNGQTMNIPVMNSSILGAEVEFIRYGEVDSFRWRVTTHDAANAHVVYEDRASDIAILAINDSEEYSLHYFDLEDDAPAIGERVYSIGHPSSLTWTFLNGIVSRVVSGETNKPIIIQATNPTTGGCSGGPLFNNEGNVVGMADAFIQNSPHLGIFISSRVLKIALQRAKNLEFQERYGLTRLLILDSGTQNRDGSVDAPVSDTLNDNSSDN